MSPPLEKPEGLIVVLLLYTKQIGKPKNYLAYKMEG